MFNRLLQSSRGLLRSAATASTARRHFAAASVSPAHLKAVGQNILAEANNLKRTTANMAIDIDESPEALTELFEGRSTMEFARTVINKMVDIYPVPLKDLWVEPDDTTHGVRIFTNEESDKSSRIMTRVDKDGQFTPYYDYFDTAMSRLGPYRPEKIVELRTVTDADPENPDVVYNNGHLLHQTTFFIGPVNFYYELDGVKHCVETDTGDSNYITPFVPHSFASRDPSQTALILAVTYAGEVRNVLADIGRLSPKKMDALAGDARVPTDPFTTTLARKMNVEMMNVDDLADAVSDSISADRVAALASMTDGDDTKPPTAVELSALAGALQVPVSSLMMIPLETQQEVVVTKMGDSPVRRVGASYCVEALSRSPHQQDLKSFRLVVEPTGGAEKATQGADLACHLHSFYFNYGSLPVTMTWGDEDQCTQVVNPGDSVYVFPLVKHRFDNHHDVVVDHAGNDAAADINDVDCEHVASMYMVRLPGALTESVIREYSNFQSSTPGQGRHRVGAETVCWYNTEEDAAKK